MIIKDKDVIVFAGDSTTDSEKIITNDGLGKGYVKLLHSMLNAFHPELHLTFINAGINGNKSHDLLVRWEKDVVSFQPDIIFCLIGINDVWRHFDLLDFANPPVSSEEYEKNLEAMVEKGKTAREFIFMTPYFMERNHTDEMRIMMEEFADIMKKVAARHACKIIDLQKEFDDYMKYRSGQSISLDRVHPCEYGSMLIARSVWRELTEM